MVHRAVGPVHPDRDVVVVPEIRTGPESGTTRCRLARVSASLYRKAAVAAAVETQSVRQAQIDLRAAVANRYRGVAGQTRGDFAPLCVDYVVTRKVETFGGNRSDPKGAYQG
jgi:hypothetical protein